ncbi:hypothetical protein BBI17_007016, partial [Phytophthora kernoviae]
MVQSQMRLVKSFERLLRKRRIWDQLQENSNNHGGVEGQNEDQMLEEMLRSINTRYPHVDTLLKEHGLGETDPAVNIGDDAAMKYSATEGMYLEFKEKKFMPFDYKTMDNVVWQSLSEGKLKIEDTQVVILKATDNMIFSKISLPLPRSCIATNDGKGPGTAEMISTMKRFEENGRVVYDFYGNSFAPISVRVGTVVIPNHVAAKTCRQTLFHITMAQDEQHDGDVIASVKSFLEDYSKHFPSEETPGKRSTAKEDDALMFTEIDTLTDDDELMD